LGDPRKKLIDWAGYEFGLNPVFNTSESVTGNCKSCITAHKAIVPRRDPPCRRCPKYLLYPATFGLHPANFTAVKLYRLAASDLRSGESASLFGTLQMEQAVAILDQHCRLNVMSELQRWETLELMWLLDRVATQKRAAIEDKRRAAAIEKAKRESKRM